MAFDIKSLFKKKSSSKSSLLPAVVKKGKDEKKEPSKKVEFRPKTPEHEKIVLGAEVKAAGKSDFKGKSSGKKTFLLQVGVDKFDNLIEDGGVERGSTILVSGGCGTGKTTFGLQALHHGAQNGERGIYISFEEEPVKVKRHMKKNYGWDFYELERKGLIRFIKLDPIRIARSVEAAKLQQEGALRIKIEPIELPFVPDRVVLDSLSALSIAFEDEENYRKYIRQLFESFEAYDSINFVLSETEQNPNVYSRSGIEEFLADGVIVLYNMKIGAHRENALEILKLRSSKHEKRLVPYHIGDNGFSVDLKKRYEHNTRF